MLRNSWVSAELSFGEVHFWMGVHKCLQFLFLFQFFRCWHSFGFLLLIKHHFLNSLPSFSIQIGQLGVLRLYLLCVDFDITFNKTIPPVLFLVFLHSHLQYRATAITLYVPEALLSMNLLAPFSINDWLIGRRLQTYSQFAHGNLDIKHFCSCVCW